jgi:hypothetical protein
VVPNLSFAEDAPVDCYFHNAVPSVAVCRTCRTSICATCRDERGSCPSCRLEERITAAGARERLGGRTGPSNPPPGRGATAEASASAASAGPSAPPPGPDPAYQQQYQQQWWTSSAPATRPHVPGPLAHIAPETRGLLAAGYPLWPLAALALLGPRTAPDVRRQATQAIAFNFGSYALWLALGVVSHIPLLGISAFPILALMIPTWFVASIVYGVKVWNGDDVRVPIVSEWLDEREGRAANVGARS